MLGIAIFVALVLSGVRVASAEGRFRNGLSVNTAKLSWQDLSKVTRLFGGNNDIGDEEDDDLEYAGVGKVNDSTDRGIDSAPEQLHKTSNHTIVATSTAEFLEMNPMIADDIFEDVSPTKSANLTSIAIEEDMIASTSRTLPAERSERLYSTRKIEDKTLKHFKAELRVSESVEIDPSNSNSVGIPPISPPSSTLSGKMKTRGKFDLFKFKGFGVSFMKPVTSLKSAGLGLRIPISPNFPQYDRIVSLPRISSMLALMMSTDEYALRASVSFSFPLQIVLYNLARLGYRLKVTNLALAQRIKRARATTSVKRLGMSFSIRYGSITGLRWGLGPWVYYLPGSKIMNRLLPLLFASPAVFIALLNIFLSIEQYRYVHENKSIESDIKDDSLEEDRDTTLSENKKNRHKKKILESKLYQMESALEPFRQFAMDIYSWQETLLQWAATKTTGLGSNFGFSKTQYQDPTIRSSIAFDIQPFLPSVNILPFFLSKGIEAVKRYFSYIVSSFPKSSFDYNLRDEDTKLPATEKLVSKRTVQAGADVKVLRKENDLEAADVKLRKRAAKKPASINNIVSNV